MSKDTEKNPAQPSISVEVESILGIHPATHHPLGKLVSATDNLTENSVPHRSITEINSQHRNELVKYLSEIVIRHHASPDAIARNKQLIEAIEKLGYGAEQKRITFLPTNDSTRKGNLAEIVLAEYLLTTSGAEVPVYRLRYNPNVDQSMKGDDVLAFDLDSDPVRIIVGEAKFRSTSSKAAVQEMVKGLIQSHNGGIPASLQFIAERLFEIGNAELGNKILNCALLFANDKLQIDYVGLLMSDTESADKINKHTEGSIRRLAVISFGLDNPNSIIDPCYSHPENK